MKLLKGLILSLFLLCAANAHAQLVAPSCSAITLAATAKATCFNYDDSKHKYWNVNVWADIAAGGGDITAVNVTGPITGGGASGDVTVGCTTCTTNAAALTANLPMIGAGSNASAVGTRSGNTTRYVSMDASTPATNDCAKFDANLNLTTAGAACGSGGGGAVGDLLNAQFVRKTADESVISSTVLQNDDALLLAIGANEVWDFQIHLRVESAVSTNDIKIDIVGPAASTIYSFGIGPNSGTNDTGNALGNFSSVVSGTLFAFGTINSATNLTHVSLNVLVVNGANAGNVTLQWAQFASVASNTTVKAGSFLVARRWE